MLALGGPSDHRRRRTDPSDDRDSVVASDQRPLHLFTLNVSGPSVSRAERLLGYLADIDPDVIVLTETRGTPGTELLLNRYREAGYWVTAPDRLAPNERGVAIVHRIPSLPSRSRPSVDLAHRLIVLDLDLPEPVTVVGVYVPSRDASPKKIKRKRTFLKQLTSLLETISSDRALILLGDLNIVSRTHEPRYSTFRSWEYDALESIEECGLVDAFLALHPGVQAYSWIGRTGDGYRYDYTFVSKSLVPRLVVCSYLHEPRDGGLTDHAGLQLGISSPELQTDAWPLAPHLDTVPA